MKQVWITATGGPETLQLREAPDPQPQVGELRVRVRASGINFADILARRGLYPDAPKLPAVVGYEVAGVVDAVGPQVDRGWLGKEVLALIRFGGYADTVVVPTNQTFEKPPALTFEQAAAVPVNYLTAWQLLVVMGGLQRDETVLIHNAGSGVGLAAIDIARRIGATIFGTASARKHAFLKERGLHEAIDYTAVDWTREVAKLTGGHGVELVTDPLGGAHWKKSYGALRHTGRLGMFGASSATDSSWPAPLKLLSVGLSMPWFNPVALMSANRAVFGVNLGHLWHEVPKIDAWMRAVLDGVREGWARPHVDATFPLAEAREAHAYVESRKSTGKVELVV